MTLKARYDELCAVGSDIVEHLPYFVDLCVELDAAQVIELGVRTGVSTVAWLYGLEQSDGYLWSVDISPAPDIGSDRWTCLWGDDLDPLVVGEFPDDVDIIFIDTSHHYEQTARELEVYLPKLRDGGLFVLHDTELETPDDSPPGEPPFPVKTAIGEFCTAHGFAWTNKQNCYGLATITVKHEGTSRR